jgi:hypothetical protein
MRQRNSCILLLAFLLAPLCLAQLTYVKKSGKTTLTPEAPLSNVKIDGTTPGQLLTVDSNGLIIGSSPGTGSLAITGASDVEAPGTASDCPYQGVFQATTCSHVNAVFSTPPSVSGNGARDILSWTSQIYGPGINKGNYGGWSSVHMLSYELDSAQRGIKQGMFTNLNCHEVGDCIGMYSYVNSDMGTVAPSDEATGSIDMDMAENQGHYHGFVPTGISGTGLLQIDPTYSSGDNWTTDGGYLINTTRGNLHAAVSGPSSPVNTTTIPYRGATMLNAFPLTTVALPITSTWAIGYAPDGGSFLVSPSQMAVPANSSAAATVTLTVQPVAGIYTPIPPAGHVCVASDNEPEQATIANVGTMNASTHTQVVTLNLRNPHQSMAVFVGGPCGMFFNFDADFNSTGMRQVYPIFGSLTGSDMMYQVDGYGSTTGNILPIRGASIATTTGDANSAVSIFQGAEVVANRAWLGTHPTLEPNAIAFQPGDVLEGLHAPHVNFKQVGISATIRTPCNPSGDCNMIQARMSGTGLVGPMAAMDLENDNPDSMYLGSGGKWTAPYLMQLAGPNQMIFNIAEAPQSPYPGGLGCVFCIQNLPSGSTSDFILYGSGGFNMPAMIIHPSTGRSSTTNLDIVDSSVGTLRAGSLTVQNGGTPSSGGSCTQGQISYDSTRLYLCANTNRWTYVPLSTL